MRLAALVLLLFIANSAFADSRFERQTGNNERVIVFVHGVLGDGISTWTNARTKTYWPKLIAEDKDFADADVYVYEYSSPSLSTSYNINELAEDLRLRLDVDKVSNYNEIIFLSHSMGGLVTREFLIKYRPIVAKIKFIYFYATPSSGSPMATLISIISKNPSLGNMRPMNVDQYLGNMANTWLADAQLRAIPAHCAYEKLGTTTQIIVEQQSAVLLCNQRIDPIDANHIDIVKPQSRRAKAYETFKSAYTLNLQGRKPVGLRVDIQNPWQIIKQLGSSLVTVTGEKVYCGPVRFSLVLANASSSRDSLVVNSISIEISPLRPDQFNIKQRCATDILSTQPHGITATNLYHVTVDGKRVAVRLIKDKDKQFDVDAQDILGWPTGQETIPIKPGDPSTSLAVSLQSYRPQPQVVRFVVHYYQNGPQKTLSERILVWR